MIYYALRKQKMGWFISRVSNNADTRGEFIRKVTFELQHNHPADWRDALADYVFKDRDEITEMRKTTLVYPLTEGKQ